MCPEIRLFGIEGMNRLKAYGKIKRFRISPKPHTIKSVTYPYTLPNNLAIKWITQPLLVLP